MLIAHVIDSMDPAQGGPPAAVAGLAAAQASMGHNVTIFYYHSSVTDVIDDHSLYNIPGFEKVTLITCQKYGVLEDVLCFSARKRLNNLIRTVEIVHIHGLWLPMLKVAAKIASQYGVKYVITPHGMLTSWCLAQKRIKKQFAMLFGWRKVLREAAFIHMLSDEESSLSTVENVTTSIEIIPNGIFLHEPEDLPPKGSFYSECSFLNNRPYVIFLGRIHHVKGIDYLIDAFEKITRKNLMVDLVIIGPDYGEQDVFEKQVNRLGIQQRVHFLGPLYGEAKYKALTDALCLSQPSRQEGFSMTIIEAMAIGLPVVITKTCRFPEVSEVGAGEVVDLDSDAISLALLRLIDDKEWRIRAGQAAKELVTRHYTWSLIAEKTVKAYGNAISANKV